MDEKRQELLEIYKLHAELADRVSQRREGANRLYVSLLIGLVLFAAALLRFGTDLERHLAYPFFTKEWELLGEGKKRSRYWRLTVVETALPSALFLLYAGLAIYASLG